MYSRMRPVVHHIPRACSTDGTAEGKAEAGVASPAYARLPWRVPMSAPPALLRALRVRRLTWLDARPRPVVPCAGTAHTTVLSCAIRIAQWRTLSLASSPTQPVPPFVREERASARSVHAVRLCAKPRRGAPAQAWLRTPCIDGPPAARSDQAELVRRAGGSGGAACVGSVDQCAGLLPIVCMRGQSRRRWATALPSLRAARCEAPHHAGSAGSR